MADEQKKESSKEQEKKDETTKIDEKVETPEQKKVNEHFQQVVKEVEQAIFSIKFYPVAVKGDTKDVAKEKIKKAYKEENETTKQLVLYLIHEALSQSSELKTMYNFETFKKKFPATEPAQLRVHVYRAMFNYNFSLEGLIELIRLLGELGDDDATKVLTYHFSFLSSSEVEGSHILRNAVIESLGNSESTYALNTLLEYAKYSDNEKLLQRIASALMEWSDRLETMPLPKKEKERLREELNKVFTSEFGGTHYG